MAKWHKFPHDQKAITFAGAALKKNWDALHKSDGEPYPKDAAAEEAWRQYHAGNFEAAVKGGGTVGIKATTVYATHLEPKDAIKIKHFQDAMEMATALIKAEPKNPNAHYQYAYAAGRYSQSISIIKALKDGYGGKIKTALDTAIKLDAKHADAHTALGAYHAEILDKVGSMIGKITYGANKDSAVEHYEKAIKLNPASPIAHIEYANGLLMLFGDKQEDKAVKLYEKAAAMKAKDAMDVLDIAMANNELED